MKPKNCWGIEKGTYKLQLLYIWPEREGGRRNLAKYDTKRIQEALVQGPFGMGVATMSVSFEQGTDDGKILSGCLSKLRIFILIYKTNTSSI